MSRLYIVMYHYVRDLERSRYPKIHGLGLAQFKQQLDFFRDWGASFVSMRQVLESARGADALPEKSVLLTFDDGYLDHFTNVFPLLDERRIPAFFSMPGKIIAERRLLDVNRIHFILASMPVKLLVPLVFQTLDHYRGGEFEIEENAALYQKLAKAGRFDDADTILIKRLLQVELPERLRGLLTEELFATCVGVKEESFVGELYLTLDHARAMRRHGMDWGIHGYDHYWMNRLTPEKLAYDINAALDVFDGIVPQRDWVCCYPYGSVSDEVVACVKSLGAASGLTTEVRLADLSTDDIFRLPRFDTNDFPPKSENYQMIQS